MTACTPTEGGGGTSNNPPVAVASADVTLGAAPLTVHFSSAGSFDPENAPIGYTWNFGDGSPLGGDANPTHTFTSSGVFLVKLTVTDSAGASAIANVTVSVGSGSNQSPLAVVAATSPSTGKAPLNVGFTSAGSSDPDGSIVGYSWNWGDGSPLGTTANPSHTFTTAGTFVVTLTVTDNFGATGSATTSVSTVANVAPDAIATVSSNIGVAPTTLSFDSSTSSDSDGIIVSRKWDFGDGSPLSTATSPTKIYNTPGNYVATLTVFDDNGASDVSSLNIQILTVNQPPVAVANATPDAGKAPLGVLFSSAGSSDPDGTIVAYEWDFGDSSPVSNDANPAHEYATPGTYTATLTVTDNRTFPAPGTDTATVQINVTAFNVAPVAVAAVTPVTGKIPLPVAFSSAGSGDIDGSIVSYEWDFGDGSAVSNDPNPSHTYAAAGDYVATLTVIDDDGASHSVAVDVHRVLNIFPTAAAAGTPTTGKGPLTVAFSSAGTADSDGTIASYAWDFDTNGTVDSTDANPTHVYPAGNYTATLTVTDDSGDSDSKTVAIVSNPNVLPTPVANSDVAGGNAPLAVAFTSIGSTDADGTITGYSWDFGDGSAATTDANPSHTYTVAGAYSAVLTVTDSDGDTASAALTINVSPNPAPVAVVSVSSITPPSKKVPAIYAFSSTGSADDGSIVSYSWSWGDGSPDGTGPNPSHTYTTVGSFVATLTVTDNGGLTNSSSTLVNTIPNLVPTAVAAVTPDSGKAPLGVTFSSAGSDDPDGTVTGYSWDFGDGSPASTNPNPTHTYGVGSFTATLTVTDDDGNHGTATVAVNTVANQVPVVVANATPLGANNKAPLSVDFSSAGSVDNDGSIVSYAWDFQNDGVVDSTDPNPNFVYTTDGTKTAKLSITDDSGDTGVGTVQVVVGPANVAPVARPVATPSSGKRPLAVQFTSDTSTDSDGIIVSTSWDFGDGDTSNQPSPTHVFAQGTHTVSLTVVDDDGASHTATVTVHSNANQAPTAHASATPPSGKRPLNVQFSSAGSTDPDDSIASYSWDFGDGSPLDTSANPSHTYAEGAYTATLTVTDEEGLTGSTTVNVTSLANQAPHASINSDKNSGLAPLAVAFTSTGSLDPDDSIASYSWDFGDGSALSTDANPSHTFTTDGAYTVTLTVTDQEGLTGTATKAIIALSSIQYVSTTGNNANLGTKASPKLTIAAAQTAAVTNGQTQVRVAGGSYGSFTVVAGINVLGGYDQSFDLGGSNGATTTTVTGAANTPAVTANGATVSTTLKRLTLQGGNGNTAAGSTGVLAQTNSVIVLDEVIVDSGTPSAAGSSAYGVRSLTGSSVTVKDSTVTSKPGVAGTNGTTGSGGTAGVTGAAATAATTTTGGGGATASTPTTRSGGAGGNGGGGGTSGSTTQVAGNAGLAGGSGATAGTAGPVSGVGGGGGAGGGAGAAGAAGTAGANSNGPGDTFVGGTGGTGGTGGNGGGGAGGGGGGGSSSSTTASRRTGGHGGGGGTGGTGAAGGTGGTAGGGSFGVYSNNASVTVTGTSATTGNGGKGGTGGAGGVGGNGGNGGAGGTPSTNNTGISAAGGGGGGGGGAGAGGSGGGGGAGGPSVGIYSVGTGSQVVSTTTATLGNAGLGGDPGSAGAGGTVGGAGAAGTTNTSGRNGSAGSAGATAAGAAGATGTAGARTVRVHSNTAPTASAHADLTTGRIPFLVTFSSTGSVDPDGTIVSYSWNFGDGSPVSNAANPLHTYTTVGAKTAVLTVTDDDGATSTSSVVITPTTNQGPTAVANGTPVRGVFPLTVNFSSAGSVDADCALGGACPGLSYSWDFGDGTALSTEANPSHEYVTPDTYTATLTVTDNEGATATATVSVNVRNPNLPPIPAASGTPTSGKEPLTVAFSSAGSADQENDGSIVSRSWDFGDGSAVSTSSNPSHTYQSAGDYTATLSVTDNDGATASTTVQITVNANQLPTAVAGSDVTSGQAPLAVQFSSAGSGDPDGTYTHHWSFGAGEGTSNSANPTHTYTSGGTFTATLTITDDNGATATSTVVLTVGAPNVAPTASFTAAPTSGKTPLSVAFDATGSSDVDGTVNSYAWTFGDGGTSTSDTPTHVYTTAGTFTATLTVTDNQGKTDTETTTITTVNNVAPVAAAAVTPRSGKAIFTTFSFSSAGSTDSDGTIVGYSWDFGDGSPLDGSPNPTHVYATAGNRTATLTVTDDNGATNSKTVAVNTVDNVAPTAAAQVTPGSGKTSITTFTFGSVGSADSDGSFTRSWNFGDGSPAATTASPTHIYNVAGNYTVTLTVTDDNGATATATVPVSVLDNAPPTVAPTVNLTSGTTTTNFNFQANAADSDGTVTAYLWTFGDGTFATTANPSNKKFNTPGTYNVTVRATDNNGAQTTSAPITITVS